MQIKSKDIVTCQEARPNYKGKLLCYSRQQYLEVASLGTSCLPLTDSLCAVPGQTIREESVAVNSDPSPACHE